MTHGKLRTIRKSFCSIGEAAELLGIPKSTYQRYEEGTAKVPDDIADKITTASKTINSFMTKLPALLDKKIVAQFPLGINNVDY